MPENVENMSSEEILQQLQQQAPEADADTSSENALVLNAEGNLVPENQAVGEEETLPDKGKPDVPAPKTVTKTQDEINREFAAVRRKAEKKFAPDAALASNIRSLFDGQDDATIRETLMGLMASKNAKDKNIPEEVSKELLRLRSSRMAAPEQQEEDTEAPETAPPPTQPVHNERTKELAVQAQTISDRYGVNMPEILAQQPEMAKHVFADGWSLYEVLADIRNSQQQTAPPPKKPAPPITRSPNRSPSDAMDFSALTSEQFAAIQEEVRKGKIVKF